jgi:four helix bundle protein
MAMGSASELENHLLLARDLHFLEKAKHGDIETKVVEVKKMLAALIRKVDIDRHS